MKHTTTLRFALLTCIALNSCSSKPKTGNDNGSTQYVETPSAGAGEIFVPTNGTRAENLSNPPVRLSLSDGINIEDEFDLARYFTKVEYIILKHPLSSQDGLFLGDTEISIQKKKNSGISIYDFSSQVFLTPTMLVAGDNYFGYHAFDKSGNYLYSPIIPDQLSMYTERDNSVVQKAYQMKSNIRSFSTYNQYALITTNDSTDHKQCIFNLDSKQDISCRVIAKPSTTARLIDSTHSIAYPIFTNFKQRHNQWQVFNETTGDVLANFPGYHRLLPSEVDTRCNPEKNMSYYLHDTLYVRSTYSDTIFKIMAPNEMEAAYVFDLGNKKVAPQDALTGDVADKFIFRECLDTDKFLFFIFTQGYDTSYNRQQQRVAHKYYCYDKELKRITEIKSDEYLEDFLFTNSLPHALPIRSRQAQFAENKLYSSYTKKQLQNIMSQPSFARLSSTQKASVMKWQHTLEQGDLLVLILE